VAAGLHCCKFAAGANESVADSMIPVIPGHVLEVLLTGAVQAPCVDSAVSALRSQSARARKTHLAPHSEPQLAGITTTASYEHKQPWWPGSTPHRVWQSEPRPCLYHLHSCPCLHTCRLLQLLLLLQVLECSQSA
jgi:hypothetical protein